MCSAIAQYQFFLASFEGGGHCLGSFVALILDGEACVLFCFLFFLFFLHEHACASGPLLRVAFSQKNGFFTLAADVIGLLDALEILAAHIVGHDWGAVVAGSAVCRFLAILQSSIRP